MMRSMLSRIALPLLLIICSTAQATETKAAPVVAKADAARGKASSAVCAACHAADGNSTISANPKLAGQHYDYLAKQLRDFKNTGEGGRKSPVMNGIAAGLSEEQVRDLAAYFASQKQSDNKAMGSKESIALGQKIYRGGDQSKGLPACAACHAANGAGMPAQYPRIAGQFAEYTEAQLKAFRNADRANDPNKMMRMVAAKMSDAEIKAVSEYIAGLR